MCKNIIIFLLIICLTLSGLGGVKQDMPAAAPAPDVPAGYAEAPALPEKDIAILYTNDVHCGVDDAIGYAGLAAYKKQLESDGCYVALVDVGDALSGGPIGSLSSGGYIIDIMNTLGYDVATVGNHEFDFGMTRFLELSRKADFPYVCANFIDLVTGKPVFSPYTILDFDGVKVAFVGVATPKTITSSAPRYFQDENGAYLYGFDQDETGKLLYDAVQDAVDAARGEGAQYVVALTHLGILADCSPWTSSELIAATSGIDAVLDGHSHSVIECERVKNADGKLVLLTSTGTKLNHIGLMYITRSGSLSTGLITDYTEKDPQTQAFIADIQKEFEAQLATVAAVSSVDLTIVEPGTDIRIVRNAETNLGDLCADAYRAVTGADVALVNGGGVRASIAAGDITYGDLLSVQPYSNTVCAVEATGQEILDALEMGARLVPAETGGFLQVSGLTYEIHSYIESSVQLDKEGLFVSVDGPYRVQNVMVGDAPLDLSRSYTLASHNYLLHDAGDGYTMFTDNAFLLDGIMTDNQALTSYLTDTLGGVVSEQYADPHGDGRIIAVEKP